MTLGTMLRTARNSTGLSLREVARRLDLSAPYVCDVELDRRTPSEDVAQRWSAIFSLDAMEVARLSRRLPEDVRDWLLAEPGRIEALRKRMARSTD